MAASERYEECGQIQVAYDSRETNLEGYKILLISTGRGNGRANEKRLYIFGSLMKEQIPNKHIFRAHVVHEQNLSQLRV